MITEPTELLCYAAHAAPDTAAAEFMYMPAGLQDITCHKGARSVTVQVMVDRAACDALNAQLAALRARSAHRPYFDFNHEDREASFWPEEFIWREGAGIFAKGEWSSEGRSAVEGKTFRSFSPTFHVDDEKARPARVIAYDRARLNMGGLVNDPAFKANTPFWAKAAHESADAQAAVDATKTKTHNTMTEVETAAAAHQAALTAKESRINELEKDLQARDATITATRERDADRAIETAVSRGAIPAQDASLKAKWRGLLVSDPANDVLLAALPGNPALEAKTTPRVIVGASGPAEVAKALVALMAKNAEIKNMPEKLAHAKEVHALYAKSIRGNKEFEDMPLSAATPADNIGTLAGTLVAQRTLELYKYNFPALGMITSDYSDQPAQYNQTTTTRIITVPAVMTYDATIDTATGRAKGWVIGTQAVTSDVSITIDNHKAVEVSFDSNTLAATARRLFDEQSEAAQYALGKAMVDSLYAKIISSAFSSNAAFTEASVDFGRRTFSKASRILNNQGVPFANRFALVNSSYFEKLEQDPTLVSLAVYQRPEIITGSQLPPISRFTPIEAPNLPTTGNMAAFFGHRCSLLIQSRVPNDYTTILGPAASYGQVMVVTNPDTGLSVLLVQYVSHQGGYAAWRVAAMWGCAVGNEKGGQIVKSA